MNSSRLHKIESFSITTFTAFSIVSLFIFLRFSSTKTVSIKATSDTAKLSPESTRAVTNDVCSGRSFKSQRKRQLVSRLGIVFHNMGFPAVTACRCYRRSSFLGHLFLQKPSDIFKRRIKIFRHVELPFGTAKHALFYPFRLCRSKGKDNSPHRYFTGYVKGNPAACRYFYGLRNAHTATIA